MIGISVWYIDRIKSINSSRNSQKLLTTSFDTSKPKNKKKIKRNNGAID